MKIRLVLFAILILLSTCDTEEFRVGQSRISGPAIVGPVEIQSWLSDLDSTELTVNYPGWNQETFIEMATSTEDISDLFALTSPVSKDYKIYPKIRLTGKQTKLPHKFANFKQSEHLTIQLRDASRSSGRIQIDRAKLTFSDSYSFDDEPGEYVKKVRGSQFVVLKKANGREVFNISDGSKSTDLIHWTKVGKGIPDQTSAVTVVTNKNGSETIWATGGLTIMQYLHPITTNAVYRSTDGGTWLTVVPNTANDYHYGFETRRGYRPRFGHTLFSFTDPVSPTQQILWMIGGMMDYADLDAYGKYIDWIDDVLISVDGITWTKAPVVGGFPSKRIYHTASIMLDPATGKNTIWVIGGYHGYSTETTGFGDDAAMSRYVNEVWKSIDGLNWMKVQFTGAVFPPRAYHQTIVMPDKRNGNKPTLWVIGGSNDGGVLNDIWKSTDGAYWTRVTDMGTLLPASGAPLAVVAPDPENPLVDNMILFMRRISRRNDYPHFPDPYTADGLILKSADGSNFKLAFSSAFELSKE